MKRRYSYLYLAALISLVTFAVYLPALRNGFVSWDDNLYVYENGNIRSLNWDFFSWALTDTHSVYWHPLTWLSHAVDYALWGTNPFGHHLGSILLHAANTALVSYIGFLLTRNWYICRLREDDFGRTALIVGGITGLIFGIHPVHVESVVWISERKDVLSAMFYLLSLLAYVKYVTAGPFMRAKDSPVSLPPAGEGAGVGKTSFPNGIYYVLSLAMFALALMSKPMAVSLPAVLLLLDWGLFGRIGVRKPESGVLKEKLPFVALGVAVSALTLLTLEPGAMSPGGDVTLASRLLIASRAVMEYIIKLGLPLDLMPIYVYPAETSFFSPFNIGAVAVFCGITIIVFTFGGRDRILPALWLYFLITLFPVLGIVKKGIYMADRFTYLPGIAPMLFAGIAGAYFWGRIRKLPRFGSVGKIAAITGVGAIAVFLIYTSEIQIAIWKNSMTLWSHIIEKEPQRIPFAYNNRGLVFKEQGQLEKAMKDFNTAIRLAPGYADAYTSRGWTYMEMGQVDRAMEDYNRAISIDPTRYIAFNNRGMVYQGAGRLDLAVEDFTRALTLKPSFAEAYVNRGLAFEQAGEIERAFLDYTSAIKADPSFANAYNNRGLLFQRTGQLDQALGDLNEAVRLNPAGVEAYNNRGLVYEDMEKFEQAIAEYGRAVELKPDGAAAYENRGIAFGKMGRRDQAARDFQTACEHGSITACRRLSQ